MVEAAMSVLEEEEEDEVVAPSGEMDPQPTDGEFDSEDPLEEAMATWCPLAVLQTQHTPPQSYSRAHSRCLHWHPEIL